MNDFIWCPVHKQQYDVVVCLNRRQKNKKGCANCKEGKKLEESLRGKRKEKV